MRLALALGWLPALALASSQEHRTLGERARQADQVLIAQVQGSKVEPPAGEVKQLLTVTTLAVRERIKGAGPTQVDVVQLGGSDGAYEAHLAGDARFAPAETVLVFLKCKDAARPGRCTLLGLAEGKLHVEQGKVGERTLESVVSEIRDQLRAARPLGAAR